jgi:hypothetical protein
MGKKRAQKDRAYLTATEWREEWGGAKTQGRAPFRRLPFHCCAISFQPFEDAVGLSLGSLEVPTRRAAQPPTALRSATRKHAGLPARCPAARPGRHAHAARCAAAACRCALPTGPCMTS